MSKSRIDLKAENNKKEREVESVATERKRFLEVCARLVTKALFNLHKNKNKNKIFRHIESYDTCIKY
jgi:hypothetical protein